jgi:hypothetical protein
MYMFYVSMLKQILYNITNSYLIKTASEETLSSFPMDTLSCPLEGRSFQALLNGNIRYIYIYIYILSISIQLIYIRTLNCIT